MKVELDKIKIESTHGADQTRKRPYSTLLMIILVAVLIGIIITQKSDEIHIKFEMTVGAYLSCMSK